MRIFILLITFFLSIEAFASSSKQFVTFLEREDWHNATKTLDKDYVSLALWLKLVYEKDANFYELTTFVNHHPNWPRINSLKQKIEESPCLNCKSADILAWFKANPPQTIQGKEKYLELTPDLKIKKQYAQEIWQKNSLNQAEEIKFLKKYRSLLNLDDHLKRINYMLYNHNVTEAARVIPLIPTHLRKSYQQRIDQQSGKKIAFVLNKNHKTDIGILYNLAHTHELNKDEDNLINTLHIASTQDKSVQMYFWRLKAKLIRTLIQRKQYKMAYLFASSHGHSNLKEYSEAEWLSGWIALRYLKEPNTAITHFNNFYSKVKMPISLSRGAYWLGRSYETLEQISKSKDWYSVAAKYYTSFYGQLSICKINNCQINLPKSAKASLASIKKFNNNPLIKAALLLDTSDKYRHLTKELLLRAIDESIDKEEITLISKIKFKDNNDHLATEMAKQAAYKNVVILESNYPFPNYIYSKHNIDHTLVLSLIRQESVFNHKAVSSAGAMGLMQLMPFVAKKTAAQLKLKYDQNKLLSDPKFNTRLGSSHIELLLNEYNNSYILSIAAYNAGSKAVDTWITDNGDPRLMKSEEDIIDWIEKISFHETRNYVQRVLENRAIYYCMINKRNQLPDILKPKNK